MRVITVLAFVSFPLRMQYLNYLLTKVFWTNVSSYLSFESVLSYVFFADLFARNYFFRFGVYLINIL